MSLQYQCNTMKRMCLAEGLDEWKIEQCLKAEQKFQRNNLLIPSRFNLAVNAIDAFDINSIKTFIIWF